MSFPVTGSKLVQVTHESDLSRKKNKKQVINTCITLLSQKWIYWPENIISLQSKVIAVSFLNCRFLDLPSTDPSSASGPVHAYNTIKGINNGILELFNRMIFFTSRQHAVASSIAPLLCQAFTRGHPCGSLYTDRWGRYLLLPSYPEMFFDQWKTSRF